MDTPPPHIVVTRAPPPETVDEPEAEQGRSWLKWALVALVVLLPLLLVGLGSRLNGELGCRLADTIGGPTFLYDIGCDGGPVGWGHCVIEAEPLPWNRAETASASEHRCTMNFGRYGWVHSASFHPWPQVTF